MRRRSVSALVASAVMAVALSTLEHAAIAGQAPVQLGAVPVPDAPLSLAVKQIHIKPEGSEIRFAHGPTLVLLATTLGAEPPPTDPPVRPLTTIISVAETVSVLPQDVKHPIRTRLLDRADHEHPRWHRSRPHAC